jgi:uncharacterized membrane protein
VTDDAARARTAPVEVPPDVSEETAGGTPGRRVGGVDTARGVALLGMMCVHVLPLAGFAGIVHAAAAGRSAALFALLAGVGLALASGGSTPRTGPDLWRARRATLARAVVIGVIGFTLGGIPTPAAIILPYYAVLFVVAILVLGWPARRLAVAAAVAAVATPVASHLLREEWGRAPGPNLSWESLATDPGGAVVTVLLTGYYPVLTWTTYLLAGLAAGRLPLRRPDVARGLVAAGAGLAVVAALGSWVAVRLAGGEAALSELVPGLSSVSGRGEDLFDESFYGTTPVTSWWFLGVPAPHSGSVADLAHTTGTALAVLGLALLASRWRPGLLLPLTVLGSMTLTLYSLHILTLAVTEEAFPDPDVVAWPMLAVNVVISLVVALLWRLQDRRGPLEELAAQAAAGAAGPSRARPPAA